MLGANNKPIIKCIQMLSYSFRIWYDFYSHYIICLFVTIVYSLHWSRKKFLKTIWQFNRNECHFLLLSLLLLPPPPPSSLLLMLMSLLLNAKAQPRTRTYIYHRIKKTNKMKKKNIRKTNQCTNTMNRNPVVDRTINYTIGFKIRMVFARMRFDNKRKSIALECHSRTKQNLQNSH